MPSDEIVVKAQGLTKRYGPLIALQEFSLQVPRGEILVLVGPNGAGKTTALKLLVGLLTPTSGDAWIAGFHVLRDALHAKQRLAFLPDQPFLYESLTVAETLAIVGGMYRMTPDVWRGRAEALLDLLGLSDAVHRRVGQLSFGIKSRLALVLSLLHEPEALIMDEPFFGLDPQTLRLIKQLLAQRAADGMSIVLSTHQLAVVEDVAHRVAIVSQGRLIAVGTLEELTRTYGSKRLEDVFFQLTSAPAPLR